MSKLATIGVLLFIILFIIAVIIYIVVVLLSKKTDENVIVPFMKMNNLREIPHEILFEPSCNQQSYFMWLYVNNWKYNYGILKSILNKGDEIKNIRDSLTTVRFNRSCPAMFLSPKKNNILFSFKLDDCEENNVYELTHIPLKKWFSVAVCISKNSIEIYLDGSLVDTKIADKTFSLNNSPLRLGEYGGFDGFICKLSSYSYKLSQDEILQKHYIGHCDEDLSKYKACKSTYIESASQPGSAPGSEPGSESGSIPGKDLILKCPKPEPEPESDPEEEDEDEDEDEEQPKNIIKGFKPITIPRLNFPSKKQNEEQQKIGELIDETVKEADEIARRRALGIETETKGDSSK